MDMKPLNLAMLQISKRAEKNSREHLHSTFVDVGPLFTLLANPDNQIIFGRRGTGKTHLLSYLSTELGSKGVTSVNVDMRTIGSTGGIYADGKLTIAERSTRLLADTMCSIHDSLLELILNDSKNVYDLSKLTPCLDEFIEQSTKVVVEGTIEDESIAEASLTETTKTSSSLGLNTKGFTANVSASAESQQKGAGKRRVVLSGYEKIRIHFGTLVNAIKRVVTALPKNELWILIDEWSEVPLDLQPILADLLRRTLYPVSGVTVKIAAIEQRCNFRCFTGDTTGHIGIEIGADASASLNLDEFMVFDNDEKKAKDFFGNLLHRHALPFLEDRTITRGKFINDLFTQMSAFEEYVRSCEGVPRDAINIIGLAAQKSTDKQISIPMVKDSARKWYQRNKFNAIQSREDILALLDWIIHEVIGTRQATGFLLSASVKDEMIDYLYDNRIIHLLKEGVSAQYDPGKRYNVYSLDYGCYADLLTTKRAPKGLLVEYDEFDEEIINIPRTDFRSIRNSILDLSKFYKQFEKSKQGSSLTTSN